MTCLSDSTSPNRLHLLFWLAICHLLFLTFSLSLFPNPFFHINFTLSRFINA